MEDNSTQRRLIERTGLSDVPSLVVWIVLGVLFLAVITGVIMVASGESHSLLDQITSLTQLSDQFLSGSGS